MSRRYYYGMRLKGFAPGCQPMRGLVGTTPVAPGSTAVFHDILVYNRPLTEQEISDYELKYITEI